MLGPSGVPAFWTFSPPSAITMNTFFSLGEKGERWRWRDVLCFHDNCVDGVEGGALKKTGCRLLLLTPARDYSGSTNHLLPVEAGHPGNMMLQADAVTMATYKSSIHAWGLPYPHIYFARQGRESGVRASSRGRVTLAQV